MAIEVPEEVMFYDTDCGGVTHNVAYLRFVERARTRLMEDLGFPAREMRETQLFPTVTRTEADYRLPGFLADMLIIRAELECFDRVRFWCAFEVRRADDLLVSCRQRIVFVQMPNGRPMRTPESWVTRFPDRHRPRVD